MFILPGVTNQILEALTQELDGDHPLEKLRCGLQKAYQEHEKQQKQKPCQRNACSDIEFASPRLTADKYTLALDFRSFKPEEVEIKLGADKMLEITGKHEKMNEDGSSYVYRQYIHHFSVPDTVQHEQLKAKLGPNGILNIEAPVKKPEPAEDGSRSIPIEIVNQQ